MANISFNAIRENKILAKNSEFTVYIFKSIRIHLEYEGRIEKFVLGITVWHHEACLVMANGDPEVRIFLSHPHTNNGFFSLLTTVFYIKISFQKSLDTLVCNSTC